MRYQIIHRRKEIVYEIGNPLKVRYVYFFFLVISMFLASAAMADEYVFERKWGSQGAGNGQFYNPRGVAVDASGIVYVADLSNYRIQNFNSSGTYITQWGSFGSGDGKFYTLHGAAVDASGNVYVADTKNYRIQKFNSSGTYITQWGSYGSGDGKFSDPYGVAVDSSGNVYVADTKNDRIQKLNSSGSYMTQWGSWGSGEGQFNNPWGVAVDSLGNVYVADTLNHRVQKFNSSGTYITQWGSWGTGDGQFRSPSGVAVDSSGNVYVADTTNNRIQKFTYIKPTNPPSRLNAKATSSSSIVLTWNDNSNNEDGFRIERKPGSCGSANPWLQIATKGPNATTHISSGLTSNTNYSYRVRAYNAGDNSAYSNCASTKTALTGTPKAPKDLNATSTTTSQIRLIWTDSSTDETSFKVYRKIGTGPWSLLATKGAGVKSHIDKTASENAASNTYNYYVTACNTNGCSPSTNYAVVPYQPANLTATPASSSTIKLKWTDKSNNETGFQVFRKTGACSSTNAWSMIKTTGANITSCADAGLTSGMTYSYKVRAFKKSSSQPYAYGYSSFSNCQSATMP